MTFEEYQSIVVAAVKVKIEHKSWYKGVCCDTLKNHYPNIEKGIESVEIDTAYYDAPNQGFF